MRLAVIITGGTILSAPKDGYISLSQSRRDELLDLIGGEAELETFDPFTILSEQLDGSTLTALCEATGDALEKDYDGIIILHGTDTLQYSAAALALAYGGADAPVVLVSGNYTLDDPRSNGRDNLKYAVEFIKQKIGGVFVSYRNENCLPEIHLGDRLLPHQSYSDRLEALEGCFGYFENGVFRRVSEPSRRASLGRIGFSKSSPVLYMRAYPAILPPRADGYKAILLETYHSGTLPTENSAFIDFCKNSQLPIYVTGVDERIQYESTAVYSELGLNILPKSSPVYAYISLWQQYSA